MNTLGPYGRACVVERLYSSGRSSYFICQKQQWYTWSIRSRTQHYARRYICAWFSDYRVLICRVYCGKQGIIYVSDINDIVCRPFIVAVRIQTTFGHFEYWKVMPCPNNFLVVVRLVRVHISVDFASASISFNKWASTELVWFYLLYLLLLLLSWQRWNEMEM